MQLLIAPLSLVTVRLISEVLKRDSKRDLIDASNFNPFVPVSLALIM